ncbi:hypothetical protein [Nitrosovibrio tenuis]|uniref:ParB-like nuclease domain-containing protein n=1 Tax=Nitrosovibrio tenuis TaxID=1233 RepID=A0A1H7RV06_9PROT|nr:hypothetical protein [Nitrosovibrio tenuis]SEL64073.1 hypothetical protein SAMN05216387_12021 [Nitrosovibrio tenuis]
MKIKISQIKLNELTQSRVDINDEIVSDYEEAYMQGARLPDIKVYFDGAEYWLADGYHRYHAASKIELLEIDADVVQGTRRDAILYSVGANAEHGLRRTPADKRKAVQTLLDDQEWSQWSNNLIAKRCAVSHTLVNEVRRTLEAASSAESNTDSESGTVKRKFVTSSGNTTEMNTARIGRKSKSHQWEGPGQDENEKRAAQPDPDIVQTSSIPDEMVLVNKYEYQEITLSYEELLNDNARMQKIVDATEGLSEAMAEIRRLSENVRILERRNDGLMREKNEAIRLTKWGQRKCAQLEKQVKTLEIQVKNYEKEIVQF